MNLEKPLTIARVIARLNVGGPAVQAISMTDVFRRKGYRTLLLAGHVAPGEETMDYLAEERGVHPIHIGGLSRRISLLRDLQSLWQLVRIFRRERPTVVHTHTAKAGTLGRLAAMLARVPVRVHTFHGHVFRGYFSPLLTRFFIAIERFLARRTDAIIAISESQKRELADTFRISTEYKIKVVPLGFQLAPFLSVNGRRQAFRSSVHCGNSESLVGWIGRMTAIKDPGLFIDSARHAKTPAKFVMLGDGELRTSCEQQIAACELGERLTVAGWRRDLGPVYADLDLLVMTSVNEGTPLALLEAMASAKAFVATDVGGVRDLMIGSPKFEHGWETFENGILVPRDASTIARAIDFLLQHDELRHAMGQAGREFAKARYSEDRLASDLENLYLQLAWTHKCIPAQSPQSTGNPVPNSL